jgi:hypothetical protein
MDFEPTEDQRAIAELAGRILRERLPLERLTQVDQDPDWFARDVWQELARAGLVGAPLPERDGGGGLGILEACLVLEEIGRTVAPVPYLATVVLGAMPVAAFGTAAQRARLLPGVIDGSALLTAALVEEGDESGLAPPRTRARRDGDGFRLDGEKGFVPALHLAARVLVPALLDDGTTAVFLVDPAAPGATRERVVATTFEPLGMLALRGVRVAADDVLGAPGEGAAIVEWMRQRGLAGVCATAAGVCGEALRLTAAHVSEREQFGQKIATFQAVAQRAADAYVDTRAIALTARQAAWRLAEGLPAAEALAIAKYWAADGGQRVAHAAQHLHGGLGVDTSYPLYRYFRWAKQMELTLGAATAQLRHFGAMLAERAPDA